jgi:hypothetical protein
MVENMEFNWSMEYKIMNLNHCVGELNKKDASATPKKLSVV